jgi:AAA+ ATPase superfamily predicted ATPase
LNLVDWPQALQLLDRLIPSAGWTLLLLDEISWMSIGDRDFAGHLKIAWDELFKKHRKLVVVLCGSVSSWIDDNILNSPGFVGRVSLTLTLEPLSLAHCNPFWRSKQVTAMEKLKILSVTGGVPRYLEELDIAQSAEHNIRRLCFEPSGMLFTEARQIFHDVFGRRAVTSRNILTTLVDGSRSVSEIGDALDHGRGGSLTASLDELAAAGFLRRDVSFDPRSGETRPKLVRFRLSDNYLRFYLKYVEPRRAQIEKRLYRHTTVDALAAWDTIFGLQLENLVLQSLDVLRPRLGLENATILNAGPYTQPKTKRRAGCQIDLLLKTRSAVYVLETKLRGTIGRTVIDDVKEKVRRLEGAGDLTVRTGIVYVGKLDPRIEEEDYFDFIIPFEELLDP